MKRWVFILPVLGFAVLAFFLFRSLWAPAPNVLPSALLNKPVPRAVLPGLDAQMPGFGPADLAQGRVTVVNVFASWCAPCRVEAPQLMTLSRVPGIAVFAIAHKDKPEATRAFLDEMGNPFSRIGQDPQGRVSIEWGVYGVPETYIVDGRGMIRFKFVGEITQQVLESQILPAIKAAQQS